MLIDEGTIVGPSTKLLRLVESAALEDFAGTDPKKEFDKRRSPDGSEYQYYQPVRAESTA